MLSSVSPLAVTDGKRKKETRRQTERLHEDRRGVIKERADGGHEEDGSEKRDGHGRGRGRIRERKVRTHREKARGDKEAERKRRGGEEEEKGRESEEPEGSSRSCGLPVTVSDSDNAFIMGKGEQRKGLIHRRVRES